MKLFGEVHRIIISGKLQCQRDIGSQATRVESVVEQLEPPAKVSPYMLSERMWGCTDN